MEYISAEEFLKQPKEVQEVFLNWWNFEIDSPIYVSKEAGLDKEGFDLLKVYGWDYKEGKMLPMELMTYKTNLIIPLTKKSSLYETFIENAKYVTPLFTEGQLRKFIEDKTAMGTVNVDYFEGYRIKINSSINQSKYYKDLGNDLLKAYWKVAVQIAKEELKHD